MGNYATVLAPSGLDLVPSVCLLPAKDKARGDHPFTVFSSDHILLRGVDDGHRLEIEYSLPFGFDSFRKLRFALRQKGVSRKPRRRSVDCGKIINAMCLPRLTQSKRFRVPGFFRRRSFVSPALLSGCSSFFHLWSASIVRVGRVASSFEILP